MLRKPWKTVQLDNGKVDIYGNNHCRETFYAVPDWSDEEHKCFRYKGETYFLEDFTWPAHPFWGTPKGHWTREFDGVYNDSFFSGILYKYADEYNETVKVYTFIS